MTAYTITNSNTISLFHNGKPYTVSPEHENYSQILESLRNQSYELLDGLIDIVKPIQKYLSESPVGITVKDGIVTYNGMAIDNSLTRRIIKFSQENLPVKPLVAFLENLLLNPSKRAVDELYDFLEVGNLPFTDDGCFLAFKNVRSDYYSIHGNRSIRPIKGKVDGDGRIFNGVGEEIEILRNQVCEDKGKTCSDGLHFCSVNYLPHFSDSNGGKTLVLKINPKDVVSIPVDYKNTKGRCCAYTVLAEYGEDWRSAVEKNESGFDSIYYGEDDFEEEEETSEENSNEKDSSFGVKPSGYLFYNVRDNKGKFTKKI